MQLYAYYIIKLNNQNKVNHYKALYAWANCIYVRMYVHAYVHGYMHIITTDHDKNVLRTLNINNSNETMNSSWKTLKPRIYNNGIVE